MFLLALSSQGTRRIPPQSNPSASATRAWGILGYVVAVWVITISCNRGITKVERNADWSVKYKVGVRYYEAKDYYRSAILFEQIRSTVRGLPEGEQVEFMLAYCQYHEKNYLLAAEQFALFAETYGRSPLAEEARFMYGYALYASAPDYTLDQQSSIRAMNAMQTFINQHPGSRFIDNAAKVIAECQQKLEKKNYKNASLYLKLRMYKAAVTAFDSFERSFPDSEYMEDVTLMRVEAQFRLAEKSLPELKIERFNKAIEFYQELVDEYPGSKALKEAEKYYVKSVGEINKNQTKNKKSKN